MSLGCIVLVLLYAYSSLHQPSGFFDLNGLTARGFGRLLSFIAMI